MNNTFNRRPYTTPVYPSYPPRPSPPQQQCSPCSCPCSTHTSREFFPSTLDIIFLLPLINLALGLVMLVVFGIPYEIIIHAGAFFNWITHLHIDANTFRKISEEFGSNAIPVGLGVFFLTVIVTGSAVKEWADKHGLRLWAGKQKHRRRSPTRSKSISSTL